MRTKAGFFNGLSLLSLLMLGAVSPARAAPLEMKLCVFDQPFSPLSFPDGCGQSLELLQRASAVQPVAIRQLVAPRSQCMNRLRSGEVDAMLAAYTPERGAYSAYPMRDGLADPGRSVGDLRFSVSHRRGDGVDWDGRQFIGLGRQPVGAAPDLLHMALLRQLDVFIDDSGAGVRQVFAKLAGKRVAAVVSEHDEGLALIVNEYGNQLELLPTPFQITPIYFTVNQAFYQKHRAQIDAYWATIAQVRQTAAYRQFIAEFPKHR